jgi:hypothetical protein
LKDNYHNRINYGILQGNGKELIRGKELYIIFESYKNSVTRKTIPSAKTIIDRLYAGEKAKDKINQKGKKQKRQQDDPFHGLLFCPSHSFPLYS